ncbi:MAG: hypothetical protein ACYC44_02885 [Patescibacteria group bacterium]|nr:hypothetical protein [Patescibacteria group bacterium]
MKMIDSYPYKWYFSSLILDPHMHMLLDDEKVVQTTDESTPVEAPTPTPATEGSAVKEGTDQA